MLVELENGTFDVQEGDQLLVGETLGNPFRARGSITTEIYHPSNDTIITITRITNDSIFYFWTPIPDGQSYIPIMFMADKSELKKCLLMRRVPVDTHRPNTKIFEAVQPDTPQKQETIFNYDSLIRGVIQEVIDTKGNEE